MLVGVCGLKVLRRSMSSSSESESSKTMSRKGWGGPGGSARAGAGTGRGGGRKAMTSSRRSLPELTSAHCRRLSLCWVPFTVTILSCLSSRICRFRWFVPSRSVSVSTSSFILPRTCADDGGRWMEMEVSVDGGMAKAQSMTTKVMQIQ
jgi:hypothetical protein